MYTRKSWIVLIAAFALTLGLAACGDEEEEAAPSETVQEEGVQGSGNVVTQEMDFDDFTAVDVHNAFVVEIIQSDSFSVTIRVDDNILDLLDVSTVGDTLRIRLQRGVSLRGDVTLEADITMPELDALKLSGAARASVSGFQSTGQLDIGLSGASTLDGDLEAGSIDLDTSGASRVDLVGSATALTLEGSGASTLDLADFAVDTADVTLSGASEATVNVQERIEPADVSGASRLRYLGDPSLGDVTTSGASTVDKIGD